VLHVSDTAHAGFQIVLFLRNCETISARGLMNKIKETNGHLGLGRTRSGDSIAEWLACWSRRARIQIAVATLSGNSHRQTAHTHCASVHQAVKLVAALLRVAGVTAGLAESNGSLPPGL